MTPIARSSLLRTAGGLLATLVLLAGCAGPLRVDNQVRSFARWTEDAAPGGASASGARTGAPQPPQVYRFERLPSQAEGDKADIQHQLEAVAAEVLAVQGWKAESPVSAPPWTVQISASTRRLPHAPWEDPWDGYRGAFYAGIGLGGYRSGVGGSIWMPVLPPPSLPYYQREVVLVIREATTGRVVYETRARHDGRWNSTPALWKAMLRAAMQGFPLPPDGPRRIDVDIPETER
ncbi:MAG: hypothetical protein R3E94_07860 [Burkholderiaceae bacterium]